MYNKEIMFKMVLQSRYLNLGATYNNGIAVRKKRSWEKTDYFLLKL